MGHQSMVKITVPTPKSNPRSTTQQNQHSTMISSSHDCKKISRRTIFLMAPAILPTWSQAQAVDPKTFEAQVNNGIRLINEWKFLKQGDDGLWQKQWLTLSDIKYDVIKSESALRPLVGTIQAKIISLFSARHPNRTQAELESFIEDAPDIPGGKKTNTLEKDIHIEQSKTSWIFFKGKARTSIQLMVGSYNWIDLPAAEMREKGGMHGHIVRAFATPVIQKKKHRSRS